MYNHVCKKDTQEILQQKISLKQPPDSLYEIFTTFTQTTVPLFPFGLLTYCWNVPECFKIIFFCQYMIISGHQAQLPSTIYLCW